MIETTQCSIQSKIKHQINRGFPNPSVSLFCRWNTAVAIWVETAPVNRSSLPSKCSYFRWAMDCLLYFSLSLSTTQKCSLTLSLSLSLSLSHMHIFIEKLCMQKTFRLISCLKILLPLSPSISDAHNFFRHKRWINRVISQKNDRLILILLR